MVVDNYRDDFPGVCMFTNYGEGERVSPVFVCMFSNRTEASMNKILFGTIKNHVGLLSPEVFMSDITAT